MFRTHKLWIVCLMGAWSINTGWTAEQTAAQTQTLSLKGTWQFALDPDDAGVSENWFARTFDEQIKLPGTLQEQGFGNEITAQTRWMGRLYDKAWAQRAEHQKYGQPGNVKVPFWLQPARQYTGTAWYQRTVTVPEAWRGRRTVLAFERVQWSSTLWLNDKRIGFDDGLSAPHLYDLGILDPGSYRLTVRVDNRMIYNIREDAHSITDSTQTNWNGLVGDIKLTSTSPVWLDDVRVFTDIRKKTVRFDIRIGNLTGKDGSGTLTAGDVSVPVQWTTDGAAAQLTVPLGSDAALWDEFNPALHRLTLQLKGDSADDTQQFNIGLREIKTADAKFYINDRLTFFRGTHEGCQFPLTGYPPTDVDSWRSVLKVCKDYGLNHMRFHSWCPPEAAFIAADELGMYLQPECSNWGQYARDGVLVEWLARETEKLVKAYGNHPSFVLFSTGNEPAGPWEEPLLKWCRDWKARDNRRVYASQTGRYFGQRPGPVPDIDYLIAIRIGSYMFRRESAWHGRDFARSLEGTNYPVISHETGQWCAFPDFSEIPLYTGSLKPKNFEIFRDLLAEKGMLHQAADFLSASGKFQLACYKEEIEALLRTPGMGGFQLLDLHDYPGQGTALVGVLNVFWQSKGYVTPEQFRRFCNVTVPLARMRQSVYTADQSLAIDTEIAHFGAAPISDAQPVWKIVNAKGDTVASGQFDKKTIPLGNGIPLGTIRTALSSFAAPQQYRLIVGLAGTSSENDWPFWVYPQVVETKAPDDVLVTRRLEDAAKHLSEGGKVLWIPRTDDLRWDCPPVGTLPIFWNRLMGPAWERFLGLLCDPAHPALADFVTNAHYEWQWQEVVRPYCRAINMDTLPSGLVPIVQMIDDWNRSYKLAVVFECRVGAGRLLVSAADLETDLDKRPVARQLRHSLLSYMSGDAFNPPVSVNEDALRGLLFDNRIMPKLGATAAADEQQPNSEAARAIDGNPNTYWLTAIRDRGKKHPHELLITFPRPVPMKGLALMPRQDHREHEGDINEYIIEISGDNETWTQAAEGRLQSTFSPQEIRFAKTLTAQYLKLRILSGFAGDTAASLAELAVLYDGPPLDVQTDASRPYQPGRTATEEIDEGSPPPAPQP